MCDAAAFLKGRPEFRRKKLECDSSDIVVVISAMMGRGQRRALKTFDICRSCWNDKIAESDVEWSSE